MRDKKAAPQINVKSITDSQLDGAHVELIFTCKCVMWVSFMCEIHEGGVAHKSELW